MLREKLCPGSGPWAPVARQWRAGSETLADSDLLTEMQNCRCSQHAPDARRAFPERVAHMRGLDSNRSFLPTPHQSLYNKLTYGVNHRQDQSRQVAPEPPPGEAVCFSGLGHMVHLWEQAEDAKTPTSVPKGGRSGRLLSCRWVIHAAEGERERLRRQLLPSDE